VYQQLGQIIDEIMEIRLGIVNKANHGSRELEWYLRHLSLIPFRLPPRRGRVEKPHRCCHDVSLRLCAVKSRRPYLHDETFTFLSAPVSNGNAVFVPNTGAGCARPRRLWPRQRLPAPGIRLTRDSWNAAVFIQKVRDACF
jgi:hypothetical protein